MAIVVFRGLLGSDESQSIVRDIEAFRLVGTQSSVRRYFLHEDDFESALLGHEGLHLAQGPLTVAALGWDPPERSTEFHLSLLSADGDIVSDQAPKPTAEEFLVLKRELVKLNSRLMTVLFGEGVDHGFVWEKRVDLLTRAPNEAIELGLKASLPEGDFENDLRRFIDDSINILSEQEFNLRRIDKGMLPINLAWPWGQGERQRLSNIALRLGYPWRVYAYSLSLRGIARLSGLRAQALSTLDKVNGKEMVVSIQQEPRTVVVIEDRQASSEEAREERAFHYDEMARSLAMPLMDWAKEEKETLVFVATNAQGDGVVAFLQEKASERDGFPFDERMLHERQVPEMNLSSLLSTLEQNR